ncbi:MAG: LytTR family DNA-binding domain-containing protein [Clostridiales bacterium]|nr:LytTR family DNA-binding domain-containing protein [Clostridiales bacterium]
MYRIAVVEDQIEFQKQIEHYLIQYGEEHGIVFEIKNYEDGITFSESRSSFDIIFLDIEMPGMNGMDAARYLRKKDEYVSIVFVTNLAQYAIDGYSVGALDFVLKPINYYEFALRLARVIERLKQKRSVKLTLSAKVGEQVIDSDDIYYIESNGKRLHYHTIRGTYTVYGALQEAERILNDYHFARCNYWYLINLKYVSGVRQNTVMVGSERLEISRRNKSAFIKALMGYIGGGL